MTHDSNTVRLTVWLLAMAALGGCAGTPETSGLLCAHSGDMSRAASTRTAETPPAPPVAAEDSQPRSTTPPRLEVRTRERAEVSPARVSISDFGGRR